MIKVRAVPGRLLPRPEPPYRPENWVGWRAALPGETPDMVLPPGQGVFDRPGRRVQHEGREHVMPKIVKGREIALCLIEGGVEVPDQYEYRRAIADGDLVQIEN